MRNRRGREMTDHRVHAIETIHLVRKSQRIAKIEIRLLRTLTTIKIHLALVKAEVAIQTTTRRAADHGVEVDADVAVDEVAIRLIRQPMIQAVNLNLNPKRLTNHSIDSRRSTTITRTTWKSK